MRIQLVQDTLHTTLSHINDKGPENFYVA